VVLVVVELLAVLVAAFVVLRAVVLCVLNDSSSVSRRLAGRR
jgi:hypothetical protein